MSMSIGMLLILNVTLYYIINREVIENIKLAITIKENKFSNSNIGRFLE